VSIVNISHPVIPGGYNCLVQGNLIGLDATGTAAVGNATGVQVTDGANLIGGYVPAARNVISGNAEDGVHISQPDATYPAIRNSVVGNLVGSDVTGARAMGNGADGVLVADGASFNLVGYNLVGFNGGNGVHVTNAAGNRIRHNFTLFNGLDGIRLEDTARNHVAWNTSHHNGRDGIGLSNADASVLLSNVVERNERDGIGLEDADANAVYANKASFNGRDGLRLDALSTSNRLQQNRMVGSGEHDGHDDSAGLGTAGTANLWVANWGVTENRPGLF
jgi:parallel beta-helix repeat protein